MNQSLLSLGTHDRTRRPAAIGIGLIGVFAALGLAFVTHQLAHFPPLYSSPFFYVAVIIAARRGGWMAGATASIASVLSLSLLAWGPDLNVRFLSSTSHIRLLFFFGLSMTIATLAAAHSDRKRELLTSQRNLADFIENAPLGLLWVSPQGEILLANKAELTMLGYSADEYVGHHVSEFHAAGDGLATFLEHLRDGRALHDHRTRMRTRDGNWRDVLIDTSALWRDGRLVHIRCSTRDITEQARAERSLSVLARTNSLVVPSLDSKEMLDSLGNLLVPELADWCAMYMIEGEHLRRMTLKHRDPALADLTRPLENRIRKSNLPTLLAEMTSLRSRLRTDLTEADIDQLPGRRRRETVRKLGLCSQIIVPLRTSDRAIGVMIMAMGPSRRQYSEEDLQLAEELGRRAGLTIEIARLHQKAQDVQLELSRANQAKDEFLGILSHELRSAVGSVWRTSRTLSLRNQELDAGASDAMLESIEHESAHLHNLVENLLTLARLEPGQEAATEPVAIRPLVRHMLDSLHGGGYHRTVRLRLSGVEVVEAEPTYLERVLHNLVVNADKYDPSGSPIDVVVRQQKNEVVFRVLDRGPGIAPDEAELIFQGFYRSERTASLAPGKGLGLTVCKRLIEAQGGRIWAKPRHSGGLEVAFALPYTDVERSELYAPEREPLLGPPPSPTVHVPEIISVTYP